MVYSNLAAFCSIFTGTAVVGGTGTVIYLQRENIFPKHVVNTNETNENGLETKNDMSTDSNANDEINSASNQNVEDTQTNYADLVVTESNKEEVVLINQEESIEKTVEEKLLIVGEIREEELSIVSAEIDEKNKEISKINAQNALNQRQHSFFMEKIKKSTSELTTLNRKIQQLSSEISDISQKFNVRESEIKILNEKNVNDLTNEEANKIVAWQDEMPDEDKKIKEKTSEKNRLLDKKAKVEKDLAIFHNRIAELNEQKKNLRDQFLNENRVASDLINFGHRFGDALLIEEQKIIASDQN